MLIEKVAQALVAPDAILQLLPRRLVDSRKNVVILARPINLVVVPRLWLVDVAMDKVARVQHGMKFAEIARFNRFHAPPRLSKSSVR